MKPTMTRLIRLAAGLLFASMLSAWPLSMTEGKGPADVVPPASTASNQSTAITSKQPAVPSDLQSPSLRDAADRMIVQLSSQSGFEDWKNASWTSYALGPGTHGWVILISKNGREIGYLVLNAAGKDVYRLSEYGKGEYPLFSMQTLYRSLVRLELLDYSYLAERLYFDPLHAMWHVTVEGADREWYLDAKTGEELPFSDSSKLPAFDPGGPSKKFTQTEAQHTIIASGQTEPFDPYVILNWVQGKPSPKPDYADVIRQLQTNGKPVFALELYGGTVLTPLPVDGYHEWSSGDRFLRIYQDDDRYLPFGLVRETGSYYP
ncbi:hypothetical protein O9H85_18435 [Paenibacillus filicis]|uniref:Copper amine oxidase N-terminal domain-containing protein n=1 Tax=Paenibacillus gyeongsangnamensis TaxID=3388067 RepID=A0ABT4QBW1_9BACL|nr:hypothetical protein [Paenibacillus filicis]MCZ8514365.1 hypothetical protein [Paenibacillus filicis]